MRARRPPWLLPPSRRTPPEKARAVAAAMQMLNEVQEHQTDDNFRPLPGEEAAHAREDSTEIVCVDGDPCF